MHFAEYFLAYQKTRKDPSIRILLMDRSVSGDIAHISWKMREYIKTNEHCLLNYSTSFGRISNLDLELGRMLISNQELSLPPPVANRISPECRRSSMMASKLLMP